MKKLALLISTLILATTCNAMQCPPASAFSYEASQASWVLDEAYKSQWLIGSSSSDSQVDKPYLRSIASLNATLAGDNNQFQALCFYELNNDRIYVTSIGNFNVNPRVLPNFHPYHNEVDYLCITSAGSSEVCQW